jgi:hypothetical protein
MMSWPDPMWRKDIHTFTEKEEAYHVAKLTSLEDTLLFVASTPDLPLSGEYIIL